MSDNVQGVRPWLWLTLPITALVLVASGIGLFVPNFYLGPLSLTVQGVAQDFIDLVIVLPVLVVSGLLTARGSQRGQLIWLGALSYLVYTFVIYAFGVRFNPLFLVYVATLGCCLWGLIGGMATTDWGKIRTKFATNTPVKLVCVLLLVQVVLFYLTWLKEDVPALLAGAIPASIAESGLPTNSVHVLDMAAMLPAITISALLLWRKRPLGYGLTALMLTNATFQGVSIAAIIMFSLRAGLPGSIGLVIIFAMMAVIDMVVLTWHLSWMKPSGQSNIQQTIGQPSYGDPRVPEFKSAYRK